MPGDNQLSGAINVGLGTNIGGRVGKKDLDDVYRFSSTGGSSLDVNLTAIVPRKASKQVIRKTRVGVEIYKLKRSFNEVAGDIGGIDFSNLSASDISANFEQVRSGRARSTRRASFAINPLDAGDYVIRVRQNKLEGRYRLSIGGTLIPDPIIDTPSPSPDPNPNPNPDPNPPSPGEGNSLATARSLNFPFTSQQGFVNNDDTQDYYKFSVPSTNAGYYKFDLSGLTADVNFEILKSDGTLFKAASTAGDLPESISLSLTGGEDYYIRVLQGVSGAASNYELSTVLLPPGNSRETALSLDLPITNQSSSVNDSDQADYYKFSVPSTGGDYKLNLTGLTADVNLEIFKNDDATPFKTATNPGNQDELLLLPLGAGDYYVHVFQVARGPASEYKLSAALLTDNAPGTLAGGAASATLISRGTTPGTLGTTLGVVKSNYVLDGAINSGEDLFKIEVTERSFLNVELKGLNGAVLTGNLDVELFGANGSAIDPIGFLTSSRPGTSAEVFGGTLKTGDYYIRIRPGTAGSGEGSEYSLSMSLNPKNNVPTVTRDISYGREPILEDDGTVSGFQSKSSNAQFLTKVGGLAYFSATDDNTETFLWKTDGTLKGTQQVKKFADSASLSNFVEAGGFLYFVAQNNATGAELWRSDGTEAGTRLVQDLNTNIEANGTPRSSNPRNFVVAGNWLYFIANDSAASAAEQFYRTNTAGTTIERVPNSGTVYSNVSNITFQGTTLFFSARTLLGGDIELWTISNADSATPGAPTEQELHAGNTVLTSSSPSRFVLSNGNLYGSAILQGSQAPSLVRLNNNNNVYSPVEIPSASGLSNPDNFVTVIDTLNNTNPGDDKITLYFSGTTSAGGTELWKLDTKTNVATSLDLNPGSGSSNPTNLVTVGKAVYFFADNGTGKKLWRDDGTGTPIQVVVADGAGTNSNPGDLIAIGTTLYFTATNSVKGKELWSFDTASDTVVTDAAQNKTIVNNTMKMRDINVELDPTNNSGGTKSSNPGRLTDIDGVLYFIADNGLDGVELMSL